MLHPMRGLASPRNPGVLQRGSTQEGIKSLCPDSSSTRPLRKACLSNSPQQPGPSACPPIYSLVLTSSNSAAMVLALRHYISKVHEREA